MFRTKRVIELPYMKEKITLPAAIVISAVILAIGFYAVQYNKQQSIEKQQQIELKAKAEVDQTKAEKDKADAIFSNNLKCQTLLKDLKQRWNNVIGISYSDWQNTCIVKYTKGGKTLEAPVESMQDAE